MFPTILVQRTVLNGAHRILPLIACIEICAFDNASAREAEHSRMQVGQGLCQVATHTVLAVLESVDGEQRYMFQGNTVGSLQENAQFGMLQCQWRCQCQHILLPV